MPKQKRTRFAQVTHSLESLLGKSYMRAVVDACHTLRGGARRSLTSIAVRKVRFFPRRMYADLLARLPEVGTRVTRTLRHSSCGSSTDAFNSSSHATHAPLSAYGFYRIGENGRLHLTTKSEHYHAPLGHSFPGYQLVEHARQLGIPNATHNNTRGHIVRTLEQELVRVANGLDPNDNTGLDRVLASKRMHVPNRVLNLETGSLAAETGVKLMLTRFHRSQTDAPPPKYEGRTPVFIVMGDEAGGTTANYHGTTVATQLLRGLWPDLYARLERARIMKVVPVRPNSMSDLMRAFSRYEKGRYKIAGFMHEIVLMNYGGILLEKDFLRAAYRLCRQHDVPTMVDEIQSCAWSPRMFLYREYGLKPSIAAVGKGMPGGEYAASRVIFSSAFDCLAQFGSLVTNGQEELASLAYLVTMNWVEANVHVIDAVGTYYEDQLQVLAARHSSLVTGIEGRRHMGALVFDDVDLAVRFAKKLVARGLDISVQTYKPNCPPSALTKLPLIAGYEVIDFVIAEMERALKAVECARKTKA